MAGPGGQRIGSCSDGARFAGGQSCCDSGGGGGNPLEVLDEGLPVETDTQSIDFVGAGVTVTSVGPNAVEVDIPGGGTGIAGYLMEYGADANDPAPGPSNFLKYHHEGGGGTVALTDTRCCGTVVKDGDLVCLGWNSESADATTELTIYRNGIAIHTTLLTGLFGVVAIPPIAVTEGTDVLAVEFSNGTTPDRIAVDLYIQTGTGAGAGGGGTELVGYGNGRASAPGPIVIPVQTGIGPGGARTPNVQVPTDLIDCAVSVASDVAGAIQNLPDPGWSGDAIRIKVTYDVGVTLSGPGPAQPGGLGFWNYITWLEADVDGFGYFPVPGTFCPLTIPDTVTAPGDPPFDRQGSGHFSGAGCIPLPPGTSTVAGDRLKLRCMLAQNVFGGSGAAFPVSVIINGNNMQLEAERP